LTVFFMAVAAVIGGIHKGIKEIKKEGPAGEAKPAALLDPVAVRDLSESMRSITQANAELRDLVRQLVRRADDMVEALQDQREITRSQIEEQHRLRAATVDLVDQMRRRS
jgi:hypothetical protein